MREVLRALRVSATSMRGNMPRAASKWPVSAIRETRVRYNIISHLKIEFVK